MFLIRTARSFRGTACAISAAAHASALRAAGENVVVTKLGGRRLTSADLHREAEAASRASRP